MKNTFVVTFFSVILAGLLLITKVNHNKEEITLNIPYAALNTKAKTQVECLAQNVLFEAGNESAQGQLAVAMVTMKRTRSSAFPSTPCAVVRQKVNNVCQFSWWCDKKLQEKAIKYNYSPAEIRMLKQARKVAMEAYLNYGEIDDPTHGAMFYHADYVNPRWKFKKTTQIGTHIFYRKS